VINFYFVSYVALACGGYEYTQNYALNRMEQALRETECANKRLKKAIKVKEQFLANISHGKKAPVTEYLLIYTHIVGRVANSHARDTCHNRGNDAHEEG